MTDSVVFKLLQVYRRANKICQETCQGKLLVCTEKIDLTCLALLSYTFVNLRKVMLLLLLIHLSHVQTSVNTTKSIRIHNQNGNIQLLAHLYSGHIAKAQRIMDHANHNARKDDLSTITNLKVKLRFAAWSTSKNRSDDLIKICANLNKFSR